MAATCMAVCKGSRKKIRGIFISSCHLPVAVECDIVILSEPGPIPQAPVGQFCRDTTYPREGTETWAGARGTTTTARHNLSPRGDGNLLSAYQLSTFPEIQLIPIRGRVGDCGHRPLLRCNHKNMMFCIAVRLPFERTQSGTRSRPQEMPSHFRNLVMPTTGGHMGPPLR